MRKQAKEVDLTQDDDDWFGSRIPTKQARAEHNNRRRDEKSRMDPPKKRAKIEISLKNQPSKFDLVPASDKLLARISSPPRDNNRSRDDDRRQDREKNERREKRRHRDRDRDRERKKEKRSRDNDDDRSKRPSGQTGSHWDREGDARDSGNADQSRREEKPRQQYYGGYGR